MKNFLLTVSFALLAVAASAQTAVTRSKLPVRNPRVAQNPVGLRTATNPALQTAKASFLATSSNFNASKRLTRATTERSRTELSYEVNGNEKDSLSAVTLYSAGTLSSNGYTGYGMASVFDYDMLHRYVGNTISKIDFACWKANYTDFTVFILNYYTGKIVWSKTIDSPNMLYVSGEEIMGDINSVDCDYEIQSTDYTLMIGWYATSFTVDETDGIDGACDVIVPYYPDNTQMGYGAYILGYDNTNGLSIISNMGSWQDNSGDNHYSSAYIVCETTGDGGLKDNDAFAYTTQPARGVITQDNATATVAVSNVGLDPISSFDYTLTLGDQTKSGTYSFSKPLTFFSIGVAELPAALPATAGWDEGVFTITKVNNKDDEYTDDNDNAISYQALGLTKSYWRKPVVEEFTSNTCGWCPGGVVAMDHIKEAMGDDVVAIAAHTTYNVSLGTDPLSVSTYETVISNYTSSFPNSFINREYEADPYTQASSYAQAVSKQLCEASMTVSATKPSNNALASNTTVTTQIDFAAPAAADQYGLIYVLTEDSVVGVSQLNYYAYYYNYIKSQNPTATDATILSYMEQNGLGAVYSDEDLGWWATNSTSKTINGSTEQWTDGTYNHVARYISSAAGSSDVVPATAADASCTIKKTISMPKATTSPAIVTSNLKLAVLLVNLEDGTVVTGRQITMDGTASEPSAIEDVTTENAASISVMRGAFRVSAVNATAEVFSADGRLVSSSKVNGTVSLPTMGKGVYLLRLTESNGNVTTQKATF